MEITKKQAEFWAFVLALMIVVAIAVLLLDFGIKTAILEESLKLRQTIERQRDGQTTRGTNADGSDHDATDNSAVSDYVLVDDPTGMETGNAANGVEAPHRGTASNRSQFRRSHRDSKVSSGNE